MDPMLWLSAFKNSGNLSFKSRDDALDFARKSAEDGRRWVRERGFSVAEHYRQNGCEILLDVVPNVPTGHDAGDSQFVSQFIPFSRTQLEWSPHEGQFACVNREFIGSVIDAEYALVFILSGKGRDNIKHIVPSEVRLERFNELTKLRINASTLIRDLIVDISGRFAERKIDTFSVSSAKHDCGITEAMIQRMAEIVDYTSGLIPQAGGDFLVKLEQQNLISSKWFSVSDEGVTVISKKSSNFGFKFGNAILCSLD